MKVDKDDYRPVDIEALNPWPELLRVTSLNLPATHSFIEKHKPAVQIVEERELVETEACLTLGA